MVSDKIEEFANVLVERSANIEEGDNVYLIVESLDALPLFEEVRRQIIQKGAFPHEHLLYDSQVGSEGMDHDWMKYASEKQIKTVTEAKRKEMKEMDAYIRIGGPDNINELSGIDSDKISMRKKSTREIFLERDSKKWVTTRWPTDALAQSADMSTSELKKLIFDAVTEIDWSKLEYKNRKIKKIFDKSNEIRVKGEGTDLKFSLEGRKGVSSKGDRNIPDGEVFYAPVKKSIEGKISFDFPGVASGNEVKGIKLVFSEGEIVDFSSEINEEFLEKMINTDSGSKYLGEFGIGTNEKIHDYVGNSLLDEKIHGTIHFAIGRAYRRSIEDEDKRNKSGIHWDLVKDLRETGKIFADDKKVFENGRWLLAEK